MSETQRYLKTTAHLGAGVRRSSPNLAQQIADRLRERIQFGEIKPGERIREVPLAAEFDVSRGPVRDALKLLERERLLRLEGRAGAVVRDFTAEELTSIFHIRADLSGLGMRMAAETEHRPAEALEALDDGVALLRRIAEDPDGAVADYIQVRRRMSEIINRIGRASYLAHILVDFEREIAAPWAGVFGKGRQRRSSETWARIVQAVRDGDTEAADAEGRRVVLESLDEILRLRNEA
ncbi:GntR family transcriptional regulator [Phenylobacterium sp.]|uniref:GntR family transcriptional regulator n=1 Tax=Phenylobacterium sp. TaxID=1871053 RepID=UPI00301D5F82